MSEKKKLNTADEVLKSLSARSDKQEKLRPKKEEPKLMTAAEFVNSNAKLKGHIPTEVLDKSAVSLYGTPIYTPFGDELVKYGVPFTPGEVNPYIAGKLVEEYQDDKWSIGAKNFAKGAASGILYGIGSWDLTDHSGLITGKHQEYGNWFTKKAQEYGESMEQIHYDEDTVWSSGYFANMFGQTGLTVGLIAESAGEGFLAGLLAPETGGASVLGYVAKMGRLGKATASMLSKAKKAALVGTLYGIKETHTNAIETYEGIIQQYTGEKNPKTGKTFTKEEIVEMASVAASNGYATELATVTALNALQFAAMGAFNPFAGKGVELGISGAAEGLMTKVLPKTASPWLKAGAGAVFNAASEGVEEGVQTFISKKGHLRAEQAFGINQNKSMYEAVTEDYEMRDAIFQGMVSGGLLGLGGRALTSSQKFITRRRRKAQSDALLAQSKRNKAFHLHLLDEALATGNEGFIKKTRQDINTANTEEVLIHDRVNMNETSFNNYITTLSETQELAAKALQGDTEAIENLRNQGVIEKEEIEHIANTYDARIQEAEAFKEDLTSEMKEHGSFNAAMEVAKNLSYFSNLEEARKTEVEKNRVAKEKDTLYNRLSAAGRTKFDAEVKAKAALDAGNTEAFIEYSKKAGGLEYTKTDKKTVAGLKKETYVQHEKDMSSIDDQQQDHLDEISKWRDLEFIKEQEKESRERRVKKVVSDAETKDEAVEAVEDIIETEGVSEEEAKKLKGTIQKNIVESNTDKTTEAPTQAIKDIARGMDFSNVATSEDVDRAEDAKAAAEFSVEEAIEAPSVQSADNAEDTGRGDINEPQLSRNFKSVGKHNELFEAYKKEEEAKKGRKITFEEYFKGLKNGLENMGIDSQLYFDSAAQWWKKEYDNKLDVEATHNTFYTSSAMTGLAAISEELNNEAYHTESENKTPVQNNKEYKVIPEEEKTIEDKTKVPDLGKKAAIKTVPFTYSIKNGQLFLQSVEGVDAIELPNRASQNLMLDGKVFNKNTQFDVKVAENLELSNVNVFMPLDEMEKQYTIDKSSPNYIAAHGVNPKGMVSTDMFGLNITFKGYLSDKHPAYAAELEKGTEAFLTYLKANPNDDILGYLPLESWLDGKILGVGIHSSQWYYGDRYNGKDYTAEQKNNIVKRSRATVMNYRKQVLNGNTKFKVSNLEKFDVSETHKKGTYPKLNTIPNSRVILVKDTDEGKRRYYYVTDNKTSLKKHVTIPVRIRDMEAEDGSGRRIPVINSEKHVGKNYKAEGRIETDENGKEILVIVKLITKATDPKTHLLVTNKNVSRTADLIDRFIEDRTKLSEEELAAVKELSDKLKTRTFPTGPKSTEDTRFINSKGEIVEHKIANLRAMYGYEKIAKGKRTLIAPYLNQNQQHLWVINEHLKVVNYKENVSVKNDEGKETNSYTKYLKDSLGSNVKSFSYINNDGETKHTAFPQPAIGMSMVDEVADVQREEVKPEAPKKSVEDMLDEANDEAAKGRDIFGIPEEGYTRPDITELLTIEDLKESKEFQGLAIDFVDHIVSERDKPIYVKTNKDTKTITMSEEGVKKLYEDKAWTKSATQRDGSKSTPLAKNRFESFDEFLTFIILHEKAHHYIFINEGEEYGSYEDRINAEAFRILDGMGTLADITQEEVFEADGKTLTESNKREIGSYLFHMTARNLDLRHKINKEGHIREAFDKAFRKFVSTYKDSKYIKEIKANKESFIQVGEAYSVGAQFVDFFSTNIENLSKEVVGSQVEKNHFKDNSQLDVMLSLSQEVKLFFAGISRGKTGFLGQPIYGNIAQSIVEIRDLWTNGTSNVEDLIKILEKKSLSSGFEYLEEFASRMRKANTKTVNSMAHNLVKTPMNMYYLSYGTGTNGAYTKLQQANSKSPNVRIRQQWGEAAKITGLMEANGFNAKLQTQLQHEYARFKKSKIEDLTNKELSNYLKYFGISLHSRTLDNIRNTGNMLETMVQSGIFKELNGALGKPYDKNKQVLKSDFVKKPLRNLVQLEIESTFNPSVTNYVGGKLVQPYRDNNLLNTLLEKLKDKDYVIAMQADKYKSYSYMLDRILRSAEDEDIRQAIQLYFNSLDALKDSDSNKSTGKDITAQSDVENHLTFLGSFMSLIPDQGIDSNTDTKYGLKFKKRAVPLMVLADSGAYPSIITEVLDLKQSDIVGGISDDVLEFLYTQTVAGEIARTQGPDINVKGQKNYKNVIFQLLEANTIELESGLLLYDYLAGHDEVDVAIIEELPTKGGGTVKMAIKELINNSIENEVAAMRKEITPDLEARLQDKVYFKTEEGLVEPEQRMEFLLKDYIINYRAVNANMKQLLFQDDVFYAKGKIDKINTKEVNDAVEPEIANINKRFEDIAKKTKANANKRYKAFISPLKLLANTQQNKIKYFKGYANDKFIQFAMRDEIAHSQVLIDLIQYSYGVKLTKNLKAFVEAYAEFSNDEKLMARKNLNEDFIKAIKTKYKLKLTKTDISKLKGGLTEAFPKIKDYFSIENTDAQEYVTWREHLFNLVGKGELSETEGRRLERKFKSQEKNGVTDKNKLTEEEKQKVVFQPIKSLYAGVKTENGVNYPIYIKSSAFPLLPELTAGKGLEALRLKLKSVENRVNSDGDKLLARASYSTANKVGEDSKNLYYLEEMYDPNMENVGRVLSREYYGIQQENPYKTDKFNEKGKDNEINVASQPSKVLFSNGIARDDKKAYDAKTFSKDLIIKALGEMPKDGKLSGKELFKVWEKAHEGLDNIAAEAAREELGLDEHFNPVDSLATFKKIRKLLEKEAIARTLPQSDVDALGIYYRVRNKKTNQVETVKELDNSIHELFKEDAIGFASPLWLSSSSDVFEALVNSLITNRFLKAKLPGDAFILGSNQGFELTSEDSVNTDNVVYISERKPGQKLKATYNKEGKMIGAEALIPSKFKKINSEGETVLIDLTEEPYSVRIGGRLYLQTAKNKALIEGAGLTFTNKVDQELLDSFSFRIPTSSLQSGAIITVVGFLPQASRDLMVTASDYITQIGEDFDIDKRQVYRKNYVLEEDDKISILNEDYFERRGGIAAMEKELNEKHPIWAARETEDLLEFQKQNEFTNVDEASKGEEVLAAVRRYRAYEDYKAKAKNFKLSSEDHVRMKDLVEFIGNNQELANKANKFLEDQAAAEANMKGIITSRKLFADKVALETKNKYYEKLLQNDMVNIYQSVYSNPDNQKFINKTLSTDVTESTVAYIDRKSQAVNWPSNSYMAQHELGKANADGAIGISVYSKLVTLNAQLQQLAEPIQFLEGFRLGGTIVSGNIGLADEAISDKLGEAQNVALDNAKLQLMLSRNDNSVTMPVYGLLHMLGLGNMVINNEEIDIASLFMAQPIIMEYVNKTKESKALFSSFASVVKDLQEKYIGDKEVDEIAVAPSRTRDGIIESIGKNINDMTQEQKESQFALLQLFLDLKTRANELTEASQLIDVATSDFGKSYHKVVDMGKELNKVSPLGVLTPLLNNVFGKKLRRATLFGNNAFNDIFPYGSEFLQAKLEIGSRGKFEDTIERKRSIMNGIRDAVYSNERLGIYGGDISVKRHELFSRVDNEPLAEFILQLQQNERHIIGRFPILQALSATVLDNHSVIKINGNKEKNSLTNNVEYEDFLALLNADITFDTLRNGQPYTSRQLAEDLAALAYLGKTENGVTDIRRFINREYLESKGFGDYLRFVDFTHKDEVNMYTPLLDSFYTELRRNVGDLQLIDGVRVFNENTNANYINILVKSVNSKAGRTLIYRTANGIIIPSDIEMATGKFEREYFQHNTDRAPVHVKYMSAAFMKENGIEEYEVAPGEWVYRVRFTPKDPDRGDWSAFTDTNYFTKMVEGKVALFEKYITNDTHSLYKKVPNKGAYGVNEYNSDSRHSSIIPENNEESTAYVPIILPKIQHKNTLTFANADAKKALEYLAKSGQYASLAQTLLPFVKDDVKVIIVDSNKFNGRYVPKTKTIEISSRMLSDSQGMEDALLEEITHSVISKDLDKYINLNTVTADGKLDIFKPGFNIGNVPNSVKKLVWMYSYYAHEIGLEKIGEFVKNKGENNPGALTFNSELFENDEAAQMIYRASQLQEFVGGMMGNTMFREKMGKKKYKKSNNTMISQFFTNLKLLLKDIFSSFVKDSVSEHSIDAIIEFLEETKIQKATEGLKKGLSYQDLINSETEAEARRINEATAKVMGVDVVEELPEMESPNFKKKRLPDCIK